MCRIVTRFISHSRVVDGDSQTAQHISLLTDGPHRNLLQTALGQTRQDGDVRQSERRNRLPRASKTDLTLPVAKKLS